VEVCVGSKGVGKGVEQMCQVQQQSGKVYAAMQSKRSIFEKDRYDLCITKDSKNRGSRAE